MTNEPCFVIDPHGEQLAYANNSLQKDFTQHNILTIGRSVFALYLKCCVLSWEAADTNFNLFGLTQPGIEPTTFRAAASRLTITQHSQIEKC